VSTHSGKSILPVRSVLPPGRVSGRRIVSIAWCFSMNRRSFWCFASEDGTACARAYPRGCSRRITATRCRRTPEGIREGGTERACPGPVEAGIRKRNKTLSRVDGPNSLSRKEPGRKGKTFSETAISAPELCRVADPRHGRYSGTRDARYWSPAHTTFTRTDISCAS
jgi:hypothetical protein